MIDLPFFDVVQQKLFECSSVHVLSLIQIVQVCFFDFFNNFDFDDKDAEKMLPSPSLKFDGSLSGQLPFPGSSPKLYMQETSADSAASSVSSLVSESIGSRQLYHRGSFLGDIPLPFLTQSFSLRYSVFKLASFLSFLMEVSRFTYFTIAPSFKTKLLRLF